MRQSKLWQKGEPPAQLVTRGFNDATGETFEQRVKEESDDYRYFPEPDLPPLELSEMAQKIAEKMPELPAAKQRRFMAEYGFVRLQDSVWIYPYDCEDLIALAKASLRIGADVLYMIVERLERDKHLREHFGLPSE